MAIAARICEYDGGAQLVKEETRAVKREKDAAAARQARRPTGAYAVDAYVGWFCRVAIWLRYGVRVRHAVAARTAQSARACRGSSSRLQNTPYCLIVATCGAAAAAPLLECIHVAWLPQHAVLHSLAAHDVAHSDSHLAATAGADRPAHARARQDPPRRVSRVQPHRAGTRYR